MKNNINVYDSDIQRKECFSILKCCLMVWTFGWKLMIFFLFFCKTKKDNPCHNKINNQSNQIKLNKKKKSGKDQKIYIDGFVIKGPRITSIGKNHT